MDAEGVTATLRNGTRVQIRPLRWDDLEPLWAFYRALPTEDRAFLRVDVTNRAIVEGLFHAMEAGRTRRLVAVTDDGIAASGTLELGAPGWEGHVGELRLVVGRPFQRQGLGMLLARQLYGLARAARVETVVVRMMRPQVGARNIFRKLGFREEIMLPDHVKDIEGRRQDLIVMRCDLEHLWQTLEDYFEDTDWRRAR